MKGGQKSYKEVKLLIYLFNSRKMIIFIFGDDDFRGKEKVEELKRRFLKEVDPSGSSLSVIDGKEASMIEVSEKCGTSSLLVSKRMIVIEDLFSNSKILEEALDYFKTKEETGTDNIIIFWEPRIKTKKKNNKKTPLFLDASDREKILSAKAQRLFMFLQTQEYVQEFSKLSYSELAKWTQDRASRRGAEISGQALRALLGLTGSDLWLVSQELDKLISYKKGLSPQGAIEIELKEVEAISVGIFDNNIFSLTDALASKNSALAIRLMEEQLYSGVNDYYLLSMMIRQVKILLQVRQALDSGLNARQISKQLNLHSFVVQKGVSQVRQFNYHELSRALSKLIEIESQLKTGRGEARALLNLFILRLSS